VTRTIILDATGLEEHMLEEPAWPELDNARLYPDQPQGITRDDGQWVLGHREYRYAVVPESPGELVLPPIRVTWWDTVNHRQRVAMLPEHRVTVLPSALGLQTPQAPGEAQASVDGPGQFSAGADTRLWQAISAGLFLLWVLTLIGLLRRGRPVSRESRVSESGAESGRRELSALRKACEGNDARQAHTILGRWVRHHGPVEAGGSLMALARRADATELQKAIRDLDAAAYGSVEASTWDGKAFWDRFSEWQKAGAPVSNPTGSPSGNLDLYAAAR
jgi:hypothetical protein